MEFTVYDMIKAFIHTIAMTTTYPHLLQLLAMAVYIPLQQAGVLLWKRNLGLPGNPCQSMNLAAIFPAGLAFSGY